MHYGQKLLGKFRVFPIDLYRIQRGNNVRLRDFERQRKMGSHSFDFVLQPDKLIHPIESELFLRPNGMSLRPGGSAVFAEIVSHFRGKDLFRIPKDTPVPAHFNLFHEHTDHYSLQTAEPISEKLFNERLTEFIAKMEHLDKDEYFRRFPIGS